MKCPNCKKGLPEMEVRQILVNILTNSIDEMYQKKEHISNYPLYEIMRQFRDEFQSQIDANLPSDAPSDEPIEKVCESSEGEGKQATYIDTLVKKCGYFDGQSPVNNGYGCNHADIEDTDEFEGKEYGKCLPSGCPMATALYPNEYPEDRKYFEGDSWQNMTDGDWLLPHETRTAENSRREDGVGAPKSDGEATVGALNGGD